MTFVRTCNPLVVKMARFLLVFIPLLLSCGSYLFVLIINALINQRAQQSLRHEPLSGKRELIPDGHVSVIASQWLGFCLLNFYKPVPQAANHHIGATAPHSLTGILMAFTVPTSSYCRSTHSTDYRLTITGDRIMPLHSLLFNYCIST